MAKKGTKKNVNVDEEVIDNVNSIENVMEVETNPLAEKPKVEENLIEEPKVEETKVEEPKVEEKVIAKEEPKKKENVIEEQKETKRIVAKPKRFNPFRYTFVNEWNGQTFED